MKQSLKFHLPILNQPISFNNFMHDAWNINLNKYIAHCKEGYKLDFKNEKIRKKILGQKKIVILIGPEGDFSNDEIKTALQREFKAVSLGNSRLRTETAGLVSVHTINMKN